MKRSPRKTLSAPQQVAKASTENRAARDSVLLRLQLCFFLSGAAGLIDQVVWTKALGQLFGYSAYAVATVLAVFMGGLALGSALFARSSPGRKTPIALYAWMELGIAATALLSLPGIALVRRLYFATYPHAGGSFTTLLTLRFLGAAVVLGIPTLLMGGTLPVLLGVAREGSEVGVRAGRLYAVNTAGAVLGTISAGFFLIPWIGLRLTLVAAAVLNAIAGLGAGKIAEPLPAIGRAPAKNPQQPARNSRLYLVCFAAVGATAITYELSWTRLLATPLGSSTYAFSLMLATFLLGISIGSACFEKWYRKKRETTEKTFASTQIAIAAAVLFSLWTYREIPELLLFLLRTLGEKFSALLAAQATACALALLPVTILFGFNFPAVLALISTPPDRQTGQYEIDNGAPAEAPFSGAIGQAIAANTIGAILAAIGAGFLLLPLIGSFRLAALSACVNISLAMILIFSGGRKSWKPVALALALFVAIAWTAWSPAFFSKTSGAFGVVLYGDYHSTALSAREMAETEDILFFKDGINATIAVTRAQNYIALKTNGKVDASNLDSGTQLLLGDLGAVFHPNPQKVLIIGFGGGMTASAVSKFPEVERIDCIEIEPGVVQASAYLAGLNRGVVSDPRLHIHFDDARNFLQTSRDQYDLVISEPSNPWIAGIAALYTDEFFAIVRAHLAPGGNFVQWVQAYGLKTDDFRMILAGIDPHFSDVSLWHSSGRDFLVLARNSTEPLSFDRSRLLWTNEALRKDFEELHLTRPESWPAYFRLDHAAIHAFSRNAPRNTDDRTLLEYSAPHALFEDSLSEELENRIRAAEKDPLPVLSPRDAELAARAATETALDTNSPRAARLLELIREPASDSETRILRARVAIVENRYAEARTDLEDLATRGPNQKLAKYWLAIAFRAQGLEKEAESVIDSLLASDPADPSALEAKVSLASHRNDWNSAIEAERRLSTLRPVSAEAQCRLGDLLLRSKNVVAAEPVLKKGVELDPYVFLCHRDLGELYRATERAPKAVEELEWSVRYFPEADPKTYVSLALAEEATGSHVAAVEALNKGRRLFPGNALLRKFSLKSN